MRVQTSEEVFEYYRYSPSIIAAVIFIVLFSTTTTLHIYQLVRTRTWTFLPLALGGLSEILGYIARILSAKQSPNYTIALYVTQSSPTLLAPALFAASIYMCLGRIILITGGSHLSLIRPSLLTIFFVAGDVLGLLVQGAGAVVMPLGTLQDYQIGSKIVIGGLAILVVYFGLFFLTALIFEYRLDRKPTMRSIRTSSNWRAHLRALFISSALIFIRSIFRLVEYSQGNNGWLMKREWTLYVFDASLMWVVLVIFNVWHPSHVEALRKGGKYCDRGFKVVEIKMEEIPCV